MVFNEVDFNLYFIARDKFIQHDTIIGMAIGIFLPSIPWYCINFLVHEQFEAVDINRYDKPLT